MNVILKMKKHPIDELFAKKLAEHRQEPSQKAFEKFQARLQEKQQKPKAGFFLGNRNWTYYAAAAGIAIALSVVFLTQNDISVNPTVASADVSRKSNKSVEIGQKIIVNQTPALEDNTKTTENVGKQNLPISRKTNHPLAVSTPENTIASVIIPTEQALSKIVDDSPEEQIEIATNTQISENPLVEITKPAEEAAQGIFKTDIGESVVLILEPAAPEVEMIPSINQDSDTSLAEATRMGEEKEEKEKSFIAKLYGEYKNFKYGEKVDLKKLGVKDVLARVDDSVIKEDITDVRDFVQRKVGRFQKRD